MWKSIGITVIAALTVLAQDGSISAERIRQFDKFLASDLLEGRGPGDRGGLLASEYMANQFAIMGLRPAGDNGTWFQRVPLVGATTEPRVRFSAASGGKQESFRWLEDLVGVSEQQQVESRLDADAIFVGHGIVAPEWDWDDFKGVDVKGKVLVLFTNEPSSADPKFFDGKALTYYGRWTYKYEEALRKGAAGALIIHTTPTAGYGWDVVRNSWGRESLFAARAAGAPALGFEGWVTREAGEKLLALAGRNVDQLLAAADSPDFRPIPLGIRITATIPTKLRTVETRNVAGVVAGSDPALKDEAVIYSAHWDHLGIGEPVNGDSIYNGAIDNGTGCAILLELARAWAAQPRKPRRSALFLAVTAEEEGLIGSAYYAAHPIFPPGKTALALNYDALFPWGRAKDVQIGGADRTDVYPLAEQVAKRLNLAITPDDHPEQGHYFRSDHFSFAKAGVPAFSIDHATQFAGKPADYGEMLWQAYNDKDYHAPSDEFHEDWDFTALQQAAEFGFQLGTAVADQSKLPGWRSGQQFHR